MRDGPEKNNPHRDRGSPDRAAAVARLKEQLGHIFDGGHYLLTHGCSIQAAPAILATALRVASNSLTYTAAPEQLNDPCDIEAQDPEALFALSCLHYPTTARAAIRPSSLLASRRARQKGTVITTRILS